MFVSGPSTTPVATGDESLGLSSDIPPGLAEKLRPLAGTLVRAALPEIERTIPEGEFRDAMMSKLHSAIDEILGRPRDRDTRNVNWESVFRRAGRAEFMAGRTSDSMQISLRAGTRAAWQQLSTEGRSTGLSAETLLTVAESSFAAVDEAAAAAVEGYREAETEARARAADVREQARRRLTRAILAPEPVADEWLRAASDAAGWTVPDRIVTVAVECRSDLDRLGDVGEHRDALVSLQSPTCVVLPDPGDDRQIVTDLVADRRAAVGPPVPPSDGHRSLELAGRLLALAHSGAEPPGNVTWCRDHLATLLLLADPLLTDQLREQIDAAFAGLTPKQRDRMACTLLVLLQTRGTHNEIAARLDVHPQTVRYRIHQLRRLFGDKLTDPDARLTMELALRAHMLLAPRR